jgi:hypothetical protein
MDNYGAGGAAGVNRRGFLKLAGMGGAAVAAVGGMRLAGSSAVAGRAARAKVAPTESATLQFRAMGALPKAPLPSYATQVVEGNVDIARQSGVLASTFFAGAGGVSAMALPGLSRSIRVTGVDSSGSMVRITGVVDDRSQLQPGESPIVHVNVDRKTGVAVANVHGRDVELALVP